MVVSVNSSWNKWNRSGEEIFESPKAVLRFLRKTFKKIKNDPATTFYFEKTLISLYLP